MNDENFTGIRMKTKDWLNLPAEMRKYEGGKMLVLARSGFTEVLIVDR